jgi:type I restriction enzyme S subunit
MSRVGGAAQPNANAKVLSAFRLPIPKRSTQTRIVEILSAYDDLIENNRRRIPLLEQAARLLYKEWFVHLRFPGHEHIQIIDGVPEGWEKKPLGELLTLQRGFDLPVSKRKEGLFPIYASTGINGYHAEAKVKGPGVVTGRSGSLGAVMYVSSDFWPLNTTLWVKEFKLVGPHYANHLLTNMQLEQYNGGAAVPTLNRNDVHRVEVLSPPSMLLRMFEDQSHGIVKQINVLTNMNLKLAKARDLLLPKLMNGEVAA